MFTRTQFLGVVMVVAAWSAAMALPRIWAARHSATGDSLTPLADAIQVAI